MVVVRIRTRTACVDVRGESRRPGGVDHVRAEPAGGASRAHVAGRPRRAPCSPLRWPSRALLSAGADARSTATPSNTTPPAITGTAVVGETLTAVARLVDRDAADRLRARVAALRRRRRRLRVDRRRDRDRPTSSTTGDVGSTLRVLETATNGEGSASAQSAPTAVVTGITAPVSTGDPVVSGSSFEGSTLSTTTGTWSGTSLAFAYQWVRCGADGGLPDGSNCPSIPGATSSSYTLVAADIGHRLRVQVTASNPAGSATAASNPSALVEQSTTTGPPRIIVEPSISGTLVQGRLLFAERRHLGAARRPCPTPTSGCAAAPTAASRTPRTAPSISGADTSTYTLAADDVGARLRIRITASNSLGVADGRVQRDGGGPVVVDDHALAGTRQHARAPDLRSAGARRAAHVQRRPLDGDDAARLLLPVAALPGERWAGFGLRLHGDHRRDRNAVRADGGRRRPPDPLAGDGAQHARLGDGDLRRRRRSSPPPRRPRRRRPRPCRRARSASPTGSTRSR